MQIRNRRAATFGVPAETGAWVAAKASRRVLEVLRGWGHRPDDTCVTAAVTLLVRAAVADGGRRVSVHVADEDEDGVAAIAVLSHCPAAPDDATFLYELGAAKNVLSCGTDAAPDGRRVWALLTLTPTPPR